MNEVIIPVMDQTTEEVTVVAWLVKEGDTVRSGQPLCEIETEKATVEVESSAAGTVRRILIPKGTAVPPLTVVALVGETDAALPDIDPYYRTPRAAPIAAAREAPRPAEPVERSRGEIIASPRARRLAQEKGVDLSTITGTGPGGRIIEDDVERAAAQTPAPSVDRVAQARAERVAESWRTIPHFYTSITIDLSRAAERKTGGTTYTDFFALAIAQTLADHPALNGHWKNGHVISPQIDLGIVVQTERGLVIPVVQNVAGHTLASFAEARRVVVEGAHSGKLSAAAMSEATFTLSNMGPGHIDQFTAIISPPQVAILSVGSVQPRPIVVDGQLAVRPAATFTLGVDHRAIDGRQSAAFLEQLKQTLES